MSKVILFKGCMFSGKSQALINVFKESGLKETEVLAAKPAFHTRDGEYIQSRAFSEKLKCVFIKEEEELLELIRTKKPKMVILDEIQFFKPKIADVIQEIKKQGIPVYCSGLNTMFTKEVFPAVKSVSKIADENILLNARCYVKGCKKPAKWTNRIGGDRNKKLQLEQAGITYNPCCSRHY